MIYYYRYECTEILRGQISACGRCANETCLRPTCATRWYSPVQCRNVHRTVAKFSAAAQHTRGQTVQSVELYSICGVQCTKTGTVIAVVL